MSGGALARAAEALAGTPFRPLGRDPATGLDCLGLLAAALGAIGRPAPLPAHYPLRRRNPPDAAALAQACGFATARGTPMQPGDALLLRVAPGQHHLAIATAQGAIVHAHAGLRHVVIQPLPAEWPIAGHWRLSPEPVE